jgi:hypothetical protein
MWGTWDRLEARTTPAPIRYGPAPFARISAATRSSSWCSPSRELFAFARTANMRAATSRGSSRATRSRTSCAVTGRVELISSCGGLPGVGGGLAHQPLGLHGTGSTPFFVRGLGRASEALTVRCSGDRAPVTTEFDGRVDRLVAAVDVAQRRDDLDRGSEGRSRGFRPEEPMPRRTAAGFPRRVITLGWPSR